MAEGSIHRVENREQVGQELLDAVAARQLELALGALAVVLQLGAQAQEPVAELRGLLRRWSGIAGDARRR